jgi:DNA repair ATPase RecN
MPVTLQDIQKEENGARFLRADLHIHSYGGSADVKDRAMTVEAIIEAAVAQGVSLVAITDHNSDHSTQTSLQYAQKYAGQLLVLPGVEVTTAHGHLLAYFPPESSGSVRDLLARINLVGQPGDRDSHTQMSMASVVHEVERLGGLTVAAHIDRPKTGFELIVNGYPNWKKDIITASGLYGLDFDDAKHLTWYSAEDEATPEGAERNKLISARANLSATAARVSLAALQNSDAHTLADFRARRELTRLKMNELSFDSFRTALIDPGARVRPTATIPPTIPRVIGVHFTGGFLDGETIHFSNNLNCFIGGRGTGKSTAVRSLAYGLGTRDDFENHDNCPDRVVIYGIDANGVLYRYERTRYMAPEVRAKEDQSIKNVPPDIFRIEFFGQGDLAEVAKDPLKQPRLLQEFLDRHISIQDLRDRESELLKSLAQNSSQIIPLANGSSQLRAKKTSLTNLDAKLKIAETGKVTEIAAFQTRLSAEKALASEILEVSQFYEGGLSLENFYRDYDALADVAGTLTGDAKSVAILEKIKGQIESANVLLAKEQDQINEGLKRVAKQLRDGLDALAIKHKELDEGLGLKVADLRQKGLSGSVEELNTLIRQRTALAAEIARIEKREPELKRLLEERNKFLQDLHSVREQVMDRRKAQLSAINKNLLATVKDFWVNLYYDPLGIIDEFKQCVLDTMQGTYLQEDTAEALCPQTTPQNLASLIAKGAVKQVGEIPAIGPTWARQICQRFAPLDKRHALETIWKPPIPIIKVRTKGVGSKQISINQLSDGQKHTILLTIAMLAESNLPLVIDQPEDDLDNAFIFDSLVSTLRSIKERRQVIVVTHNANIAVLGDSELIHSMKRIGDKGTVTDRGSIDRGETKKAVQGILEGGELAFRRRKEIYGH